MLIVWRKSLQVYYLRRELLGAAEGGRRLLGEFPKGLDSIHLLDDEYLSRAVMN